jgi:hypothetical protein
MPEPGCLQLLGWREHSEGALEAAHPVDGNDVLHAELAHRVQQLRCLWGAAATRLTHNAVEGRQRLHQGLTLRQLIIRLHRLHHDKVNLSLPWLHMDALGETDLSTQCTAHGFPSSGLLATGNATKPWRQFTA